VHAYGEECAEPKKSAEDNNLELKGYKNPFQTHLGAVVQPVVAAPWQVIFAVEHKLVHHELGECRKGDE
jgi:hypothetical protein